MGRRAGRKKTRKVKMMLAQMDNGRNGDGTFWCKGWQMRVDMAVCVVRQQRQSGECYGCKHYRGV